MPSGTIASASSIQIWMLGTVLLIRPHCARVTWQICISHSELASQSTWILQGSYRFIGLLERSTNRLSWGYTHEATSVHSGGWHLSLWLSSKRSCMKVNTLCTVTPTWLICLFRNKVSSSLSGCLIGYLHHMFVYAGVFVHMPRWGSTLKSARKHFTLPSISSPAWSVSPTPLSMPTKLDFTSAFETTEHVIPCQHIRGYPHSTKSPSALLKLAIKQYTPTFQAEGTQPKITIVAAHANGIVKVSCTKHWRRMLTFD